MDFLDLQFNVLRCIGIFPVNNSLKWTSTAFNVYRAVTSILLILVVILMTVQLFVATDLTILARTIDVWTVLFTGLYKWGFMIVFSGEFAKLNTSLVQIQAQGSIAHGKSADRFFDDYLKPSKTITRWYLLSGTIMVLFVILNPILTYPKGDRTDSEYFNDPKAYPLSCWIPFTVNDQWTFLVIYLCHIFAMMMSVMIYLVEKSNETIQSTRYNENQQKECYTALKECVKHHVLILNYIKKIQTLFSTLIIVDYLHGMTSVTFALFQLTISESIGESFTVMSFFLVSIAHQFLNNLFGEFIIQKQLSVGRSLYNMPWWCMTDKKLRQMLNIMICRTLKPNMIVGFHMYKLCNESFISFSKALYTYYMVLRRINVQDQT